MRKLLLLTWFAPAAALAQMSGPLVSLPDHFAVSETLISIAEAGEVEAFTEPSFRLRHSHTMPKVLDGDGSEAITPEGIVDAGTPYTQTATYQPSSMPLLTSFEGLGLGTPGYGVSSAPPDTTLGVSDTQIVQWVNTHLAIYDKSGAPLLPAPGFVNGNAVWSAFPVGTLCRDVNRGDPLVQFDRIANRWVLSQFAFNSNFSQNAQCIAVSQTDNALGAYNIYQYSFSNQIPDYGKLGVWPNAYFLSYNMFTNGTTFAGGQACAYDRAAMLAGLVATQICFNSTSRFNFLPADFEGELLPPAGTPNFHVSWNWVFLAGPPYALQLTKFVPDFVTPANSTFDDGFGGATFSFVGFDLASGTLSACNDLAQGTLTCVPQVGTSQRLDSLGDRQMYRLVYRNFGDHEALLFTQSVDLAVAAPSTAQLRWWEIRDPGAETPVVHQNSTFAPNDEARWMSSAAFDKLGNIAIGYSASSSTINPGIRVAGRRKIDPKDLLRTELLVQAGTGSQTSTLNRWGDYSTMQIDPADDCTFWYTTQYLSANGTFNWRTRIASFRFPSCT